MTDQFSTEHCCGESLQFGTNEAIWSLWAAVGPSLASHPTCPNHPIKNVLTHMHRLEHNFSNQVKRLPKRLAGEGGPPERRSTVFGGFMNTRVLGRLKFACLAVILFAALSAHAQFRTSIQGTVTDPDGAVIPNAKLELKDNANNHVINATSDAGGVFNFNALPAALVFSTDLHVRAFCADSAELPAAMSARSTTTFGGKVNSHCSAAGAFPCGDSSVNSNDPDAPRVTVEGAIDKDCAQRPAEASTETTPRAVFLRFIPVGPILTRTLCLRRLPRCQRRQPNSTKENGRSNMIPERPFQENSEPKLKD